MFDGGAPNKANAADAGLRHAFCVAKVAPHIGAADSRRWQRQEMKGIGKKIAIPVAFVLLGGILLWIGNPARNAKQIVPGMSFETVLKLLGEPENTEQKDGMNLCYFKPNFAAAGQIKVGFDNQKKAVYLKIWEDVPPQWDLRKGASSSQPAAPPDGR